MLSTLLHERCPQLSISPLYPSRNTKGLYSHRPHHQNMLSSAPPPESLPSLPISDQPPTSTNPCAPRCHAPPTTTPPPPRPELRRRQGRYPRRRTTGLPRRLGFLLRLPTRQLPGRLSSRRSFVRQACPGPGWTLAGSVVREPEREGGGGA